MAYFNEDHFGNLYLQDVEVYDLDLEGELPNKLNSELNELKKEHITLDTDKSIYKTEQTNSNSNE
jgi:hypothetical protein